MVSTFERLPMKLVAGIVLYLLVYLPLFFMLSMNTYERELILKPIKKILKRDGKGEKYG